MLFERGAPLGGEPRRGPRPLADETLAYLGVTGLFQEGHAERRPGRDQRSVAVVLTPKGTETAARVLASRERALSDAVGVLTLGERKALTGALEKVLARITADRAHADQICRLCDLAACPQPACPVELAARDREQQVPGRSEKEVIRP